mmetsp:Transcript_142040/g.441672  ORF Transcript_142040/g.441672 Transcript_142040/m.441672 type:complete len:231 (+) Transcript_142040:517-1209(+)
MLGRVHLLEEPLVHPHAGGHVGHAELVQQGPRHHRGRRVVRVEAELVALRVVVPAVLREDGVADAGQVRRLGQVVATAAGPDEHVVRQVSDDVPRALLGARQRPAERGDVLVVPGVAVGDGGALGDAGYLVSVVPPRHDARVLGRVLVDPLVALQVVVDQDVLSVPALDLVDDLRVGQGPRNAVAVLDEGHQLPGEAAADENVGDQQHGRGRPREDRLAVVVQRDARPVI